MSYSWITNSSSPNYTPGSSAQATWGRPRTIEAIAIHWWGDPASNPSFEGVVSWLCNKASGVSAHLVATGTGRRVACLIDFGDASWATNSANPYTISIELDPRCRNEDYDVAAEVIAQLRQVYGDLPLVPHRQFVGTQCPGNYDLGRLDREARNKVAKPEWDWGHVEDKVVAPVNPPVSEVKRDVFTPAKKFKFNKDARFYNILNYTVSGASVYGKGTEVEINQKLTLSNGNVWYRTAYSSARELATGFRAEDLDEVNAPIAEPPVIVPPVEPVDPEEPPTTSPEAPGDGFTEEDRTILKDIQKLLHELSAWFKRIFNTSN